MSTKYDADFAAWAVEQAAHLRARAANALDWDNLAEEIESMGRSERREIYARLKLICQHLLKWEHQRSERSRSWRATIRTQRDDLERVLLDSPSLRAYAAAELARAYAAGQKAAIDETGVESLPAVCPWTIEQVTNPEFWPGGSGL